MKNKIVILVGTTASGKTTIQRELGNQKFHKVITATTREKRIKDNEQDGVDYHFYSEDTFKQMIKENKFAEYESFGNNIYGTPWKSLENNKTIPCAILEPKGAKNLKGILEKENWDVKVVWVDCPLDMAIDRVKNRDVDNPELLEKRLKLMDTVERDWHSYMDYDLVVNGLDDPEKTSKKIKDLIKKKKNTYKR